MMIIIIIIIIIINNNNNNNSCIQKITIIFLIFRIGMGFSEDHESLVIKPHASSHIEVAY